MESKIETMEKIMEQQHREILFARVATNLLRAEKIDDACKICEDGLKKFPAYAPGHYVLAKCYLEQKKIDEARTEFERVLRYDPNHINAIRELTLLHKSAGLQDLYKDYLRLLITLDPLNETYLEEAVAAGIYRRLTPPKEEKKTKIQKPPVDLSQFDNIDDDFETILKGKTKQPVQNQGDEDMISLGSSDTEEETAELEDRTTFKMNLPSDRIEDISETEAEDFEDLNELQFNNAKSDSKDKQDLNVPEGDKTDVVIDPAETPSKTSQPGYEELKVDEIAKKEHAEDIDDFKQPKIVSQTLGEILVSQKKYSEALRVFEKLQEQQPENQNIKKKISYLTRIIDLEK